ncbi:hypothetical protein ABIB06_002440 [Bradyrhizobium sp. LB8.2]|uniref:hypothetical protein n=1 Tax=unclassified Bradyrhizobium TaxID=2631580 RepID=UPI003394A958
MKRDPELLQKLIDGITETGTIKNACRMHGVSNGAFFNWCKQSTTIGDEEFMVSIGDEPMLFHNAVRSAQRAVSFEILENFRYRMLHGTDEVARFQGKTVFQRFPELDGWSDDEIREVGLERYKRDPLTGDFMPELIHHEPVMQGVLALLAAEYGSLFGNKQTIEVNSRTTGVQVVKHQFAPKPRPVQEIAPAPPIATIEAPIDAEATDIVTNDLSDTEPDDLSDVLGEAPRSAEPVTPPPPTLPTGATPPPGQPAKPLSELQRDLLDRLARRPGAARASAVVMPNVGRPEADDLDPRRTGAGSAPPANAIKMV